MSYRVDIPVRVGTLGLLERTDYEDAFGIGVTEDRAPEEWLRLSLEGAPRVLIRLVREVQGLLGLRLHRASVEHPLGWTVLHSDRDMCILGAEGPVGIARIIGITSPGRVVFATQLQFEGARGRWGWVVVAPLHRLVARLLLHLGKHEGSRSAAAQFR